MFAFLLQASDAVAETRGVAARRAGRLHLLVRLHETALKIVAPREEFADVGVRGVLGGYGDVRHEVADVRALRAAILVLEDPAERGEHHVHVGVAPTRDGRGVVGRGGILDVTKEIDEATRGAVGILGGDVASAHHGRHARERVAHQLEETLGAHLPERGTSQTRVAEGGA